MNMSNGFTRTFQLFAGMALVSLTACSTEKKQESKLDTEDAVAVVVATPSMVAQNRIQVSGQVEASQSANISTRVMGFITSIKVNVGDQVSSGQLLVTISNQDMVAKRGQTDAMISEAKTALANAQKDYDRFTALYKQQSATAKELDNVTMQYQMAQSRLEAAMQMRNEVNASLGYTNLTAPFSGIVTQKLADAGSMANPGMTILTIEQSGSYQVSAAVPENAINQILTGANAIVRIQSLDKTIQGTVSQINPSSQFTGGQYIIKVKIADADKQGLYAGMYATLSVQSNKAVGQSSDLGAVMVPLSSIERKDQLTGLYTVGSNQTALLRWVRLGKTFGDKVEVLSGLEKSEQYVVSASGKLYNGIPIKMK